MPQNPILETKLLLLVVCPEAPLAVTVSRFNLFWWPFQCWGVLWNAPQLGSVQCFSHDWTGLWAIASCQGAWYHWGLSPLTLNPRLRLCLPGCLLWVLWGVTGYSPVYIEVLGRKPDALGGPVEGSGVASMNPALDMSVRTRGGRSFGARFIWNVFLPHVIVIDAFFSVIRGKLLYNVVVVSAIWQYEPAIIKHISAPSWAPSLPPIPPL